MITIDISHIAKHKNKLVAIRHALTLVDTDRELIVTICKEMAFKWIPIILDDVAHLYEENAQLQVDNLNLNLQNDSLLQQNVALSQRLHHQ
ncbi:hypothetical protein EHS13_25450 [Paenibacillus psychroresistens]|uniref:Uncharacterized protein n=1 Tax=Paenibacillus psychroresistens TaxID=1778678 RepID=A0A6B8RRW6_9BACL|nr:hypothetical protein [Paenibacillus psychroresistens]QGQ97998.1 hypothetical protein EHS13_25450 [Paenibacillus psychroresistens]